jgi:mono/diheme cytochrome c family protein
MMAQMSPAYMFWRVSEGASVEPFKSMRSAMPAWKSDLSVADRWAVIAYQHTFSGHRGAHDVSQHPELRGGEASPRR